MSRRLKLIVAYDGAPFAGWQSQAHRNTVQDHLERAFTRIDGAPVRVHGAGRTDAGVHALAQCAHVDVQNQRLESHRWLAAVNAQLPPQLRILSCRSVGHEFHARFSATGKTYRYRIWTGPILPPLEHGRVWHLPSEPVIEVMKSAAAQFAGRHDFRAFAANRGKPETDTIRTIRAVAVRRRGSAWTLEFDGDGFLYKMVRLMVGSVMDCATGRLTVGEIRHLLQKRAPERRVWRLRPRVYISFGFGPEPAHSSQFWGDMARRLGLAEDLLSRNYNARA